MAATDNNLPTKGYLYWAKVPELKIEDTIDNVELKNMTYAETNYRESNCSDEPSESLAQQVASLELSEDDRYLRDMGVVNVDGTLTIRGKDALLQILFNQNKADLVAVLQACEDAEYE